MGRKLKKYILLPFLVFVVIAVIIVYQIWNKPHQNIKDADALNTTAQDLYTSLSGNSSKIKSFFINKVVSVKGEVKQVSTNQLHQQIILLKTNIPQGSVNCTMEEKVKDIKIGNAILLKGICIGYIGADLDLGLPGDVFLIRCYRSN